MTLPGLEIRNAWLRLIAEQARNRFTISVQHRNLPCGTPASSNIVNGGSDDAKARDNHPSHAAAAAAGFMLRGLFSCYV